MITATAAPVITATDRLSLTIFLAAAVHAILILGVSFSPLDLAKLKPPAALEIILVQNHSEEAPEAADYLAQAAQNGGGESELRERPGSPFTSSELSPNEGIAPQPMLSGAAELNRRQQQPVLTQLHSDYKMEEVDRQDPNEALRQQAEPADYDLEIARLTAELKQSQETYAKRPKKLVLTASTHEYLPAQYMYQWVEKVERIGNLNYPLQALRNKKEGMLMLEVEIKWDGSVVEVNVVESSGNNALDDAAMHIVELSSPFAPFPADLRKAADHLEIVRTWRFTNGNLNTE
ncbi:MAG TPA: TonB family protein [Gammaproteobacteria bacterium]|nr:TonB family protein [Gammaproteobacteria bacterium]